MRRGADRLVDSTVAAPRRPAPPAGRPAAARAAPRGRWAWCRSVRPASCAAPCPTASTSRADERRRRCGPATTVSGGHRRLVYAAAAFDRSGTVGRDRPDRNARSLLGGTVVWFAVAAVIVVLLAVAVAALAGQGARPPAARPPRPPPDRRRRPGGSRCPTRPRRRRRGGRPVPLRQRHGRHPRTARGLEQQFLLSVSHDLRTPLTSIQGYAEAIADGTAPDPAAAGGVILRESRRLNRLVRDLLDLARLDAH